MNRIYLDDETIIDFLVSDCGIKEEAAIDFVNNKLWSNELTFMENANNCRKYQEKYF